MPAPSFLARILLVGVLTSTALTSTALASAPDTDGPREALSLETSRCEVVLDRLVVRPTKADGRGWDAFGGKPDLQVIVRNLTAGWVYTSPVAGDRLQHTFGVLTGQANVGDTLEIDVWDKDISFHDHIGLKRLDLTAEMLERGSVDLMFGQVSFLRVRFFPVRDTVSLKVEPRPEERGFEDGRIATLFEQRAPSTVSLDLATRSPDKTRAIVLIHGFRAHPFDGVKAYRPYFDAWQQPHSALVKSLVELGDVYGYSYGQNGSLARVSAEPALREAIGRLKAMGYKEVVLIGHSAGGIIARELVETHPDCGVTSVIQVCAPNAGTCAAHASFILSPKQVSFLASLTPQARMVCAARRDAKLPADLPFVCLVGTYGTWGDGVLSCYSQWPADLQEQGVPAFALAVNHHFCMDTKCLVRKIAEAVEHPLPRMTPVEVAATRKVLFGTSSR